MSSNAAVKNEPQPIVACTISRDVQVFDLLIEDMEAALGETWGDLSFDDALPFLQQPEARTLEFFAIAMDHEDEARLDQIKEIIGAAKEKKIKVILITEDVSPAILHTLLREGGDEFVPYPLPEDELANAIERVLTPVQEVAVTPEAQNKLKATGDKSGVLIAVHGLAGGTGATTLAVNLAWELANISKDDPAKVCLLDLDLQFGSTSTALDLPRRESVLELLSDTEAMDNETFMQALLSYNDRLHVLTSPTDMIPLDLVSPEDVARVLETARTNFDYVIIDMPSTMVEWSQTVLEAAHVYFATLELDMRSAQNTLPGFTDLNGKSRVKRLAESLGISIEVQLPDGGKVVGQNSDHGVPMAEGIPKNPMRKEIMKLAASVHAVNEEAEARG